MATPIDETFEPIEVRGFAEEQNEAKIPPLPDEKYAFVIETYDVLKCGENAKNPGAPYVKFSCRVQDSDSRWNNRVVRTGPFMLSGPGLRFFIGDGRQIGFVDVVTPARRWSKDKGITLLNTDGTSDYLDSFIGCKFVCNTITDLDSDGEPNGWNSLGSNYTRIGG